MIRWLWVLALLSGPATAQDLPAMFSVTGVNPGDVLNIRQQPDAGSGILGELAPDATGVEIVQRSDDGKWGQVAFGESTGWVSTRYLEIEPSSFQLAEKLQCLGAEPFWSLGIAQGKAAQFDTPDGKTQFLPAGELQPAKGRSHRFLLQLGDDVIAILRQEICTDGMSDRVFGIDADLVMPDGQLLTGCCRLLP
ncbi:SH3 domain-containing protein [Primorskyibacter sp. S87]|uniref:SH3 domain-containing protein n=1 Tax=Primorskyibacter sp. S87 TaxID=3415126 RepID=UPI003C7C407C